MKAKSAINVDMPNTLLEAVGTIKARKRVPLHVIYAEAVQEFVLRFQRDVSNLNYVEDSALRVVLPETKPGDAPPKSTDAKAVLPPTGNTTYGKEEVELLASFHTLKRRNPILAQALTLAIMAAAREGIKDDGQSLRTASENLDEAVLNVYRTLEEIGASAGGTGKTPSGAKSVPATTPGKSKRVKDTLAS